MRLYNLTSLAVVFAAIAIAGCNSGGSADSGGQSEMDRMAQQLEQENARKQQAAAEADASPSPAVIKNSIEEPSVVTTNDMKKGSTLRGQGSYLSAVGAARYSAEHQMILTNMYHALDLYNAEHGRYPKSHEEFEKVILEPNDIELPELMPGYEYMYDPADHKLKKRSIESGDVESLE